MSKIFGEGEVPNCIEFSEINEYNVISHRSPEDNILDNSIDAISVCCSLVSGNFHMVGDFYETEENLISRRSTQKWWKYYTILNYMYSDEGMSVNDISDICPVSRRTVKRNMRNLGVIGKKRVDWTVEDSWDKAQSKTIKRDGECLSCGITNDEHEYRYGRSLTAHHVVPRRLFDEKRNADSLDNLVSLCQNCHQSMEKSPRRLFIESLQ